jgi:ATP-dependent DNA ligase
MLEKLSAMQIKCRQRAQCPIVGFVKDPAGVATLHTRQAGAEGHRLCQVGAGFNRHSSMEIRKKLDAVVSSKPRLVKVPRLKGASRFESRSGALRSSPRSMRGSVSCAWCSLSASALSSRYSL